MVRTRLWVVLSLVASGACASPQVDSRLAADISRAREAQEAQAFEWAPWSKESFERARREGRYILFHGAAAWCHWCHVMEETTYRDAEIGRILRERFVAIRVDVDARPD